MTLAKVSIVVAVYNVREYVSRCVASLLDQSYKNIEIIVVDDGSTDGSAEACDALGATDSRVVVVHKENGGLSSARNYGLKLATGRYAVFVDGDDVVSADFVRVLMKSAALNCNAVVSSGLSRIPRQDADLIPKVPESYSVLHLSSSQAIGQLLMQGSISESACAKLMNIDLWKKHPFPEGRVYEDLSIMAMVLGDADDVAVVDMPLYGQVYRPGSITRKRYITSDQYIDAYLAVKDTCDFVQNRYGSTFENELVAFKSLRYSRLVRLFNDVDSPSTQCSAIRRSILDYLRAEYQTILSSDVVSPTAKVKTALIVRFPRLYEFLYKINEAAKKAGLK